MRDTERQQCGQDLHAAVISSFERDKADARDALDESTIVRREQRFWILGTAALPKSATYSCKSLNQTLGSSFAVSASSINRQAVARMRFHAFSDEKRVEPA